MKIFDWIISVLFFTIGVIFLIPICIVFLILCIFLLPFLLLAVLLEGD